MLLVPRKLTKEELIDGMVAKNTDNPTTNHDELRKKGEKSIKNNAKKLKISFSENITLKKVDLSKNELVKES